MLQNGAEINFKSFEEWTPLHVAVDISIDGTIHAGGSLGEEPTELIKYLLDNGVKTPWTVTEKPNRYCKRL